MKLIRTYKPIWRPWVEVADSSDLFRSLSNDAVIEAFGQAFELTSDRKKAIVRRHSAPVEEPVYLCLVSNDDEPQQIALGDLEREDSSTAERVAKENLAFRLEIEFELSSQIVSEKQLKRAEDALDDSEELVNEHAVELEHSGRHVAEVPFSPALLRSIPAPKPIRFKRRTENEEPS